MMFALCPIKLRAPYSREPVAPAFRGSAQRNGRNHTVCVCVRACVCVCEKLGGTAVGRSWCERFNTEGNPAWLSIQAVSLATAAFGKPPQNEWERDFICEIKRRARALVEGNSDLHHPPS